MSWHGLTDGFSFFPVCLGFKRKVYGGRAGQKLPLYHLSHSFFHMLWYILRQGNVPLDSRKKAFCLFFILSINCTRVNPPTTLYLFCASCEENQSLQDYSRMPYGMGYFSSPTFLHFLLSFWLFFFLITIMMRPVYFTAPRLMNGDIHCQDRCNSIYYAMLNALIDMPPTVRTSVLS